MKICFCAINTGETFCHPEVFHPLARHVWERFEPLDIDFLALHFQEIGGEERKTDQLRQFRDEFVSMFGGSYWISDFFCSEETNEFTALGSLYLVHRRMSDLNLVRMWSFDEGRFLQLDELNCSEEEEEEEEPARLTRFRSHSLHHIFPHSGKDEKKPPPRKGYLKTRWLAGNRMFDLINVHLFHDSDNLVAMQATRERPSKYAERRREALLAALRRAKFDEHIPTFVFGDFNFRPDLGDMLNALKGRDPSLTEVVKPKGFWWEEKSVEEVVDEHFDNMRGADTELDRYNKALLADEEGYRLYEQAISFPPTYPIARFEQAEKGGEGEGEGKGEEEASEQEERPSDYDKKRAPAWTDRILASKKGHQLAEKGTTQYTSFRPKSAKLGLLLDHDIVFQLIDIDN
uniref:inositol-polyphosphate 5-phosphatase n=1 Tax=Palpitomonas bilix TaxID=652834 RepID=A0A7S3DCJ9_9EUKA|mmetsp:Transcript_31626/g.82538  ORF Transcript_31626/g.82538 Transcript_31626/m.82538 type:complete len:403 (+) Transcript_31626:387-1595(+)